MISFQLGFQFLSLLSLLITQSVTGLSTSTTTALRVTPVIPRPSLLSAPRMLIDDVITRQICRHLESIIYDGTFTSLVPDVASRVSTSDYLVWLTLLLRPKIKDKSSLYTSLLLPHLPDLPFQISNKVFQKIFTFAFKNGYVSGGIVGYTDEGSSILGSDNFEYIFSPNSDKIEGVRIRDCHFLRQAQCYSLCERGCAEVAEHLYNEVGGAEPDQLLSVEPEWQSVGGRGCQWEFGVAVKDSNSTSSHMC